MKAAVSSANEKTSYRFSIFLFWLSVALVFALIFGIPMIPCDGGAGGFGCFGRGMVAFPIVLFLAAVFVVSAVRIRTSGRSAGKYCAGALVVTGLVVVPVVTVLLFELVRTLL